MADWWAELAGTQAQAWHRILRGLADRRAPARHPVLATAGLHGGAEARVVVLRGASRTDRRLEVHSDAAAGKAAEIAADPRATLLIWEAKAQLQIRLRVTVTAIPADPDRWARVPEAARQVYGGTPPPGTVLEDPADWTGAPTLDRFLALDCALDEMETLHLGPDRHRRALFRAADGWRGRWIAP